MLEILFEDEHIIAINKSNGLLVHRSSIARDADTFAVQMLRDQIGQQVFPAHRLDRKTSGVLLFTKDANTLKLIRVLFDERKIGKRYLAIVRGYTEDSGEIDYALTNDKGKTQEAFTKYETIRRTEIDIPLGKFSTSRYSLVSVTPETGRMHQIRKHFAHILHPIIGDRPHGCNKQNRHFKSTWQSETMMLHALSLHFIHPITHKNVTLEANTPNEFDRILQILKLGSSFDATVNQLTL